MTQRALALGRRGRSRRPHHATKQPWHPPIRKLDAKIEKLRDTLVPEQRSVLSDIEASIADRTHHLLTGDPGAGKTYLMQVLAVLQQNAGRKVVMTAPTHQGVQCAPSEDEIVPRRCASGHDPGATQPEADPRS